MIYTIPNRPTPHPKSIIFLSLNKFLFYKINSIAIYVAGHT